MRKWKDKIYITQQVWGKKGGKGKGKGSVTKKMKGKWRKKGQKRGMRGGGKKVRRKFRKKRVEAEWEKKREKGQSSKKAISSRHTFSVLDFFLPQGTQNSRTVRKNIPLHHIFFILPDNAGEITENHDRIEKIQESHSTGEKYNKENEAHKVYKSPSSTSLFLTHIYPRMKEVTEDEVKGKRITEYTGKPT